LHAQLARRCRRLCVLTVRDWRVHRDRTYSGDAGLTLLRNVLPFLLHTHGATLKTLTTPFGSGAIVLHARDYCTSLQQLSCWEQPLRASAAVYELLLVALAKRCPLRVLEFTKASRPHAVKEAIAATGAPFQLLTG
jgi:hypothetical protein